MIEVGDSYIFRYRVKLEDETKAKNEMCIRND